MSKYTKLIPKPTPNSINSGLSPLHQSTVLKHIGAPSTRKTVDCAPPTNPKLKAKIVTRSVGPFRVTGHKAAVDSLEIIFKEIEKDKPDLYKVLGSAGMLCCRLVRGSQTSWSNHSWGFALDLTIEKELDAPGNNKIQAGLLELYPYFHKHGWWWGAEFSREDGMHFEVANETFLKWVEQGLI